LLPCYSTITAFANVMLSRLNQNL